MFSAQQLTNLLQKQVEQSIEIRLVADPGFASCPFSEVLGLLGVTLPDHTCKVVTGNHPLEQTLHPRDGSPLGWSKTVDHTANSTQA